MVMVEGPHGRHRMLMSGGGLLARLHRLTQQRGQLTVGQQIVLDAAQARVDETVHDLHGVFHSILQREVKTRLDNLAWFLDDGEADRTYLYDDYAIEMRNRQRLEELVKELGDDLDEDWAQELAEVDERIRALCRPATFIWEPELAAIYPADPYWYLYLEPELE